MGGPTAIIRGFFPPMKQNRPSMFRGTWAAAWAGGPVSLAGRGWPIRGTGSTQGPFSSVGSAGARDRNPFLGVGGLDLSHFPGRVTRLLVLGQLCHQM